MKVVISLSTRPANDAGHRIQHRLDLVDGQRARSGIGDHRGGQRSEPFLASGIVRRAGGEQQLDVQLRQRPTSAARRRSSTLARRRRTGSGASAAGGRLRRRERRRWLQRRRATARCSIAAGSGVLRQRRDDQAGVREVLRARPLCRSAGVSESSRPVVAVDRVIRTPDTTASCGTTVAMRSVLSSVRANAYRLNDFASASR